VILIPNVDGEMQQRLFQSALEQLAIYGEPINQVLEVDIEGDEATSEEPRDRPWQIMLTGSGLGAIDAATRQALEQILELFTEVGGLVVQTTAGDVSVTRDFPSDYTIQVDRLLGEIFKNNPAVTGIKFLGSENAHTATPDDPHWSAHGKAYAASKRPRREVN
jgi:hypothetical protein